MSDKKVELHVDADADPGQPLDVNIREGEAAEVYQPKMLQITGTITAPARYLAKQNLIADPNAYVIYDKEKRYIQLNIRKQYKDAVEITGSLSLHRDLLNFHINEVKQYTRTEFKDLIKFARRYFVEESEYQMLLDHLVDLRAKVDRELDNSNDERGNKESRIKQKVDTGMIQQFTLNMPVFRGGSNHSFTVQVLLDATEKGLYFWLESVELKEIIDEQTDMLIDDQLWHFSELPCIET